MGLCTLGLFCIFIIIQGNCLYVAADNYNSYNSYSSYDRSKPVEDSVNHNIDSTSYDVFFKLAYILFGGVCIFMVLYFVVKCCYSSDNNNSRTPGISSRDPRVAQSRQGVGRMFNHALSRNQGIRSQHHNTSVMLTPCLVDTDHFGDLNHHSTNISHRDSHNLDLPPSYENSTSNSTNNLNLNNDDDGFSSRILNAATIEPPSYEYAATHESSSHSYSNQDNSNGFTSSGGDTGGGGDSGGGGGDSGGGGCDSGGGGDSVGGGTYD